MGSDLVKVGPWNIPKSAIEAVADAMAQWKLDMVIKDLIAELEFETTNMYSDDPNGK